MAMVQMESSDAKPFLFFFSLWIWWVRKGGKAISWFAYFSLERKYLMPNKIPSSPYTNDDDAMLNQRSVTMKRKRLAIP